MRRNAQKRRQGGIRKSQSQSQQHNHNFNHNNNKKIKEEVVKMRRYSKTKTYEGFEGAAAFEGFEGAVTFDCSSDI